MEYWQVAPVVSQLKTTVRAIGIILTPPLPFLYKGGECLWQTLQPCILATLHKVVLRQGSCGDGNVYYLFIIYIINIYYYIPPLQSKTTLCKVARMQGCKV